MWINCSENDWVNYTINLKTDVFFDIDYLKAKQSIYSLDLNLLCYIKKGEILGLLGFFSKKNKIKEPEWLSHTAISFVNNLKEVVFHDIMNELLVFLKEKFVYISFKLPLSFNDVRPFIWNGFDIDVKYTHTKTDFLNIAKSLNRNIKNVDEYFVSVDNENDKALDFILDYQNKYGVEQKDYFNFKKFIYSLSKQNKIKFFTIYSDTGTILCSMVVLLDFLTKKSFLIMINDFKKSSVKNIHSYLTFSVLKWLNNAEFLSFDFCGANIKSVSNYKSFYNTNLENYYLVSYSKYSVFINKCTCVIKKVIKKVL